MLLKFFLPLCIFARCGVGSDDSTPGFGRALHLQWCRCCCFAPTAVRCKCSVRRLHGAGTPSAARARSQASWSTCARRCKSWRRFLHRSSKAPRPLARLTLRCPQRGRRSRRSLWTSAHRSPRARCRLQRLAQQLRGRWPVASPGRSGCLSWRRWLRERSRRSGLCRRGQSLRWEQRGSRGGVRLAARSE